MKKQLAYFLTGLVLLGTGLSCRLAAQEPGSLFDHITTANGLTSNGVSDIIQDREGFYWISTNNGLNRFDGTNIKTFYNQPADKHSLIHNHCNALLEDDEGNIWVGTMKGISCFVKKENRFRNFSFVDDSIATDNLNRVYGFKKDHEGNIWAYGVLLMKYLARENKWINYTHYFTGKTSESLLKLASFDQQKKGIWICTSRKIYFFDIGRKKTYSPDFNPMGWKIFSEAKPWVIESAADGKLWFHDTRTKNIVCFDPLTNTLQNMLHAPRGIKKIRLDDRGQLWIFYWVGPASIYDPQTGRSDSSMFVSNYPKSILNPNASHIYIDREKNYWIASNFGISILNRRRQFYNYYRLNDTVRDPTTGGVYLRSITPSGSSSMWMATNQGLYRYDLEKRRFERHKAPLLDNVITAAFEQSDTLLWLGILNRVVRYDRFKQKPVSTIPVGSSLMFFRKDASGRIWASTWSNGLYCFSPSGKLLARMQKDSGGTRLKSNSVIAFEPGREAGVFWIGYNSGMGFSRLNTQTNRIEHFTIRSERNPQHVSNTVNCIYEDPQQNLWLGTYGGGLYFFDRQKNRFINYQQPDGLRSNFINAILPDHKGNLWISTTAGLNYFNLENKQIIALAVDLSLPSNDFLSNGLKEASGKLYFFSQNILVEVDPANFNKHEKETGPLLLTSVKIFDQEIPFSPLQGELALSYRQNFFSFDFSLLKTNPAQPVHYLYRLEGFDKGWNTAVNRNTVNYTNVPPGRYVFRLKASDQTGRWIFEAKPLVITIDPPFWLRWWFWLLVASVCLGTTYALYRYRMLQMKKFYELRNKISQDLHDEVGATLSGIALYSNLIKNQIRNHQLPAAEQSLDTVEQTATEMVNKLNDIVWAVNPRYDNVENMISRLQEYALQMTTVKNIACHFQIAKNIYLHRLPMVHRKNIYLICKEAINNAVKYSKATELIIRAEMQNDRLKFSITDNGSGFDEKIIRRGEGLHNMKQRADEINAVFSIEALPGRGSTIHVQLNG